ncbi:DUF2310 family Zn-ribbon-containing protein [Flammeovirgaceae bacterium SG7u.111]|nr:DUF2310 family Zn-ribbon-containing protein [Flammeovirgaceae bacterium SG7u.132]WPO37207.1 DUF2310 family Zn-ribbon-containing protein [Flammeovirgaceae bacterium SG7u.111]
MEITTKVDDTHPNTAGIRNCIDIRMLPFIGGMHIVKLNIIGKNVGTEKFFEIADFYFQSLYDSRQIINEEWQYVSIENGVSLNLFCPEPDSFKETNSTIYANKWRSKIEKELSCLMEFHYLEIDPEFGEIQIPEKKEFIILKTARFSPLIEGVSLKQIPLYKIPYTYYDEECYSDINFWENNYVRIEGLWFNGAVGEKWAQNQLQSNNSELSKQGIECCKKIEEVTGIPTYYYLFNYRAWGKKKDKKRKCPNCGDDWLVERVVPNVFYAFKCDKCRLISEFSSNS